MGVTSAKREAEARSRDGSWLEIVRQQVSTLSFGLVQIVVHDGRVVQVDRTEKVRFANPIAISTSQD